MRRARQQIVTLLLAAPPHVPQKPEMRRARQQIVTLLLDDPPHVPQKPEMRRARQQIVTLLLDDPPHVPQKPETRRQQTVQLDQHALAGLGVRIIHRYGWPTCIPPISVRTGAALASCVAIFALT